MRLYEKSGKGRLQELLSELTRASLKTVSDFHSALNMKLLQRKLKTVPTGIKLIQGGIQSL